MGFKVISLHQTTDIDHGKIIKCRFSSEDSSSNDGIHLEFVGFGYECNHLFLS